MQQNKVAVMGCGWLGLPLAKDLVRKGFEVNGSTKTEAKLTALEQVGIKPFLIEIDVNEDVTFSCSESALEGFFDVQTLVLNIPPRGRNNPNVVTEHLREIKSIVNKAKAAGVQQFIFISSTGVYGNENRVVTEADALAPQRSSAKALKEVEEYLQNEKDLKITVLRMSGLIGGTRQPGRFFAGKTDVKGGDVPINMVWQEDCIQAIEAVIEKGVWNETINICADEHPMKRDYYTQRAKLQGFEVPTFIEEKETSSFKLVSNEKSKKLLNMQYRAL